jgi:CoA:oxalate CoA-transferase
MSITGKPDGPPVRPGVSLGDIAAGQFLAIAILAALQERHTSGEGQMIDISMLDCQLAIQENAFARYLATGEVPHALGTRHPVFTPFQVFPTKDGYIAVATMGGVQDQWPLFCAVIDRIDLIDDEKYESGWQRAQRHDELEPILNEALKKKTTGEWIEAFEEVNIPCGPLNTIDRVAADPQVAHRNMIIELHHPGAGDFKVVNTPIKLSRTSCNIEHSYPELGEHTENILKGMLGISDKEITGLRESGVI